MQKLSDLFLDNANFRLRCLSALVMVPLVLVVTIVGGWVYAATVIAVSLWGLTEWMQMVRRAPHRPISRVIMAVIGLAYMGGFCWAMLQLGEQDSTVARLFYLYAVVWLADIGAYITGRMIGGVKLWPSVSPNKTWAGLLGGMALSGVGGLLFALYFNVADVSWLLVMASVALGGFSQLGDLFESWVKRWCKVKDSGMLIPGHGGILDRIDGLVFAAIAIAMLCANVCAIGFSPLSGHIKCN